MTAAKTRALVGALAAGFFLTAGGPASAEEVQVIKSGKYYGTVDAYRAGDNYYLSAKEASRIYGGSLYWYRVRDLVQLSFRGRQARFTDGGSHVNIAGKKVKLARPMIVRAGKAFIPMDFFETRAFSNLAGVDTRFKVKTRLLLVDQRSTVGPLRWFTYPDHTRVVLELDPTLSYRTSRSLKGFEIVVPMGTIDWSEKMEVNDGVVDFIHLYQRPKQARLVVRFESGAKGFNIRELQKPRRVVLDVTRAKDLVAEARAQRVAMEAPAPPKKKKRWRFFGRKNDKKSSPKKKPAPKPKAEAKLAKKKTPPKAGPRPERGSFEAPRTAERKVSKKNTVPVAKRRGRRYRIAIDPGHGGRDGGAVGRRGTLEKNINLSAAKELAALLRQEGIFEVKLLRTTDKFLGLDDRSKAANNYKADLFISLHCNAHTRRSFSGFEVYFLSERASDPEAERLAEFENSVLSFEGKDASAMGAKDLLYALAKAEFINEAAELAGLMTRAITKRVDMPNRGVKQAAFYVLRGVHAPAVLVEMGFVTNAKDEAKLQSKKYRRKIVEGLYAGIVEYGKRNGWRAGRKK